MCQTSFHSRLLLLFSDRLLLLFEVVGEPFLRNFASLFDLEGLGFVKMNGIIRHGGTCRWGFLAVLLLSAISLKADPVVVGEGPPRLEVVVPVVLAVLAEAVCIRLLLRRWRKPGLFLLWLMGMHLLTYPLFLGALWL